MSSQAGWTTLKLLAWTKDYLTDKGVENARLESEWMLCAATGLDRVGLYLQFEKPLNEAELTKYRDMVLRRGRREPLQHILGSQEFAGLEFKVSASVLVPRYDTEVLTTVAIKQYPTAGSILDIGTGSGCIAVTIKKRLPHAKITATDISEEALSVAIQNAEKHGAEIEFLHGSLFSPINGRRFDLIVSNPPYIPSKDICCLQDEVSKYDPKTALDGGEDGLDIYRQLISQSSDYLNDQGWIFVEIGVGQADDIVEVFNVSGRFYDPIIFLDNNCIQRVIGAMRKERW